MFILYGPEALSGGIHFNPSISAFELYLNWSQLSIVYPTPYSDPSSTTANHPLAFKTNVGLFLIL